MIKIATGLGVRIDCKLLDGITWTPGTTQTRAGGFQISDVVQDVHEAREEMAQRTESWKDYRQAARRDNS